jgi:hypothetical protein
VSRRVSFRQKDQRSHADQGSNERQAASLFKNQKRRYNQKDGYTPDQFFNERKIIPKLFYFHDKTPFRQKGIRIYVFKDLTTYKRMPFLHFTTRWQFSSILLYRDYNIGKIKTQVQFSFLPCEIILFMLQ